MSELDDTTGTTGATPSPVRVDAVIVDPVVDTWRLVARSVAVLLLFVVLSVWLIRLDLPLEERAGALARRGGLPGVFIFVLVVDTFTVPATLDLLFPVTQGWRPVPLLAVMSGASILGGILGYWIGRLLYHLRFVRRTVAGYYRRGVHVIERYGYWGVVLAALTPLPFSTVSWIAGMVRLPFHRYVLAALWRIPRVVGYWFLLQAGLLLAG
jgi:membrane protein YqaA with SNARE-associated domain